jgi:hypothetical protein
VRPPGATPDDAPSPIKTPRWEKPKYPIVTTQDFTNFWGKIFVFVLLEMFGNSQGFKTF